jgi:adenine-specific DNA-methyltransferase
VNNHKGKLELIWVGKEERQKLEPRILAEDPKLSYGDNDAENMLIHGDNLLALRAMEQDFGAKIKCIFIDPPYNTGSAFTHYDDGLEHSIWLQLVRERLEILQALLADEGSIWITIDDAEGHYLKVICDEVFGRVNFIGTVAWQKTTSVHNNATLFSSATDMVLAYAKDISRFTMGRIPRSERNAADYANPDDDPRGPWTSSPLHVSLTSGQRGKQYAATGKSSGLFPIVSPLGEEVLSPKGRCWGYSKETIDSFQEEKLLWWGKDGRNQPRLKRFLSENKEGVVPTSLWLSKEVGSNQEAKAENLKLLPEAKELFATPKPERLLCRILQLGSQPGDWVLDSFAGSGTTGAVAHKMGRRWIMVEIGDHCYTHIIPRLKKVIDGTDQGGISETVGWKGGGGFRVYRLAETLLVTDKDLSTLKKPVYVINPKYDAAMLIRAVCKIENFRHRRNHRWHGISSEHHFLYVTTNLLNQPQLDELTRNLGPEDALLIYCTRRASRLKTPDNIEIKKIPRDLLPKCTFEEGRV